MNESSGRLARPDGEHLAWRRIEGEGPTVVWLGGYRSDMGGTKAQVLAEAAARHGWAYLRYDHFAHGESSGDWARATIGRYREDALAVLDELVQGPAVLVGSSMGGWVATLAALARPDRLAACVMVAPAPDFSDKLMWPALEDHARQAILRDGGWTMPGEYGGERYELTREFFEDGRRWQVLDGPVGIICPVRILQGMQDPDVPWTHALKLAEAITGEDVVFTLVKGGDHRLSRPQDLRRLVETVAAARRL